MIKEEFIKLTPYQQFVEMKKMAAHKIGSWDGPDERIREMGQWFDEVLEQKGYVKIPHWGWIKSDEIEQRGIDPFTGDVLATEKEIFDKNTKTYRKIRIPEKAISYSQKYSRKHQESAGYEPLEDPLLFQPKQEKHEVLM